MKSKVPAVDKQASEIMLFISRCSDATKHLTPPPGTQVSFRVVPINKTAEEALKRAKEMQADAVNRLGQAIRASDRAEREQRSLVVKAQESGEKKPKPKPKKKGK